MQLRALLKTDAKLMGFSDLHPVACYSSMVSRFIIVLVDHYVPSGAAAADYRHPLDRKNGSSLCFYYLTQHSNRVKGLYLRNTLGLLLHLVLERFKIPKKIYRILTLRCVIVV